MSENVDANRNEQSLGQNLPLAGKRVLVTRAREQAQSLSDQLRNAGAEPVEFPTIEIGPPDDPRALDEAVRGARNYNWIIFTSVNGVTAFFERMAALGVSTASIAHVHIAAIGTATANAVLRQRREVTFVPKEFIAEEVLAGLIERGVANKRVLLPRAAEARDVLPNGLREAGASIHVIPAYRTVPANPSAEVLKRLEAGEIDLITFTSSSTVRNFMTLIDNRWELTSHATIACIGPITAATAREAGLHVDIVADEYSIPGLVNALIDAAERSQL